MQEYNVKVLIIGAGPAGATAALNLAPFKSVILVDKLVEPCIRIGESLPAAARSLLADMGLLEEFKTQNHYPYHGNQFYWGTDKLEENDFLRSLNTHGWHLDRPKFEKLLRSTAQKRGACIIAPAKVISLEQKVNYWQASILYKKEIFKINTNVIINATGRNSYIASQLGAKKISTDRLISSWIIIEERVSRVIGLSFIESTISGWWYTAPIPNKRRIISFQTDPDLEETIVNLIPQQLLKNIFKVKNLSKIISNDSNLPINVLSHGYTAANSAVLSPCTGNTCLATGDAALCFDPISSQGLFNALYTGLAAAETVNSYLDTGDKKAFEEYQKIIDSIWNTYQQNLKQYYSLETRWPQALFWSRRNNVGQHK